MVNSRAKGATFERAIANQLFLETGITFKRELNQYRERDRGDLIPDNPAWPFMIECKAYGSVKGFQQAWATQAFKAAEGAGLHPCVIWKIDRQPIQCRVWFDAIAEAMGGNAVSTQHADITLQGLAWLARGIMNGGRRKMAFQAVEIRGGSFVTRRGG